MDRIVSVTWRPKPPVAKITRARVRASRSQVWARFGEVLVKPLERHDQRPGRPVGPKSGVHLIERAGRCVVPPGP